MAYSTALHTGVTLNDEIIASITGNDVIEDFLETKTSQIIFAYREKLDILFSKKVM